MLRGIVFDFQPFVFFDLSMAIFIEYFIRWSVS